ncbi:MAG: MBL fold metallo-hydrolase [Pseudomonadota bacterium]
MFLQGRPVSLTVLDYGFFRVHGSNGTGPRDIGLMGGLVITDAGERVLIDTGLPAKYARDPSAGTEDGLDSFGRVLSMTEANLPSAQLALCGVECVDLVIITHTHIDHIGGLFDFHDVPMLISAPERALPRPLYWTGGQPWEWPDREWGIIDGDGVIGPGFEVYLTPGHAPGQLAFCLELPETGRLLWCSDAISRPAEVDEEFVGSWNSKHALFHAKRLLSLEHDLVIYGHDPAQWSQLKKAPACYC